MMRERDLIASTLTDFAIQTKHKDFELSNENKEDHFIKKMLATQTPRWKPVYRLLSNDMDRIEFRAPLALKNFSESPTVDYKFLTNLLTPQKYDKKVLANFRKKTGVSKQDALSLYFANKIYKENHFIDALVTLCDDDIVKANNLHETLVGYKFMESPIDLANMIDSFDFKPQLEKVIIHTSHNQQRKDYSANEKKTLSMVLGDSVVKNVSANVDAIFRKKENVIAYKIKNDLPTQYSSLSVANKLLLEGVHPAKNIIDVVDYYPQETIDYIINTPQAWKFYEKESLENPQNGITKQEFIKKMFIYDTSICYDINKKLTLLTF